MKRLFIFSWTAQVIVALILLQTLFFKFTSAPESVYIFSQLGIEPWGRYLSGIVELGASILLLVPGVTVYGALLALAVILPALYFHIARLGIVVQNDNGLLFMLALLVAVLSMFILYVRRTQLWFVR